MVKVTPDPLGVAKFRGRWEKGIWLGRTELNDVNIVGCAAGVVQGRSVKRLPLDQRWDSQRVLGLIGVPAERSRPPRDPLALAVPPVPRLPAPVAAPLATDEVVADADDSSSSSSSSSSGGGDQPPVAVQADDAMADVAVAPTLSPTTPPDPLAASSGAMPRSPWTQTGHQRWVSLPLTPVLPAGASSSTSLSIAAPRTPYVVAPSVLEAQVKRHRLAALGDGSHEIIEDSFFVCAVDADTLLEKAAHDDMEGDMWECPEFQVREVFNDEDAEVWAAKEDEVKFLTDFGAYVAVDACVATSTPNAKWISSRWECGRKSDGVMRARWVLREFASTPGEGAFFAGTPASGAVEMLHVKAVREDLAIIYIDLSRAFHHAPEEEEVFTTPPAGFEQDGKVWKLLRKIPGRRDGSRSFSDWIMAQLVGEMGFRRSALEPCALVHDVLGISLALHVDDGIVVGELAVLQKWAEDFGKWVLVKVTRPLLSSDEYSHSLTFLSTSRSRGLDGIAVRPAPRFVDACAELLGLVGASPTAAPSTLALFKDEGEVALSSVDHSLFRCCVGKLIYVQDAFIQAQFVIKELARELVAPTDASLRRLRHVVRYLLGWQASGNVRWTHTHCESLGIDVICDSNWAGCLKSRKSTDMVIAKLFGSVVSNSCKTQATVALSSAEAESAGLHRGAMYGVYLSNLWNELFGQQLSVCVWGDSSAGLAIGMRLGVGRVRHLEVRQLYLQKLVSSKRVTLRKLRGEDNAADIGTKVLSHARIKELLDGLGFGPLGPGTYVDVVASLLSSEAKITRRRRRAIRGIFDAHVSSHIAVAQLLGHLD